MPDTPLPVLCRQNDVDETIDTSLTAQLAEEYPDLAAHAAENPLCSGCNGLGRVRDGAYVDDDRDVIETWKTCVDCSGGGVQR